MNHKKGLQVTPTEVINLARISSFLLESESSISISSGSDCHTITTNERASNVTIVNEGEFQRIKRELEEYFGVILNPVYIDT